MNAKEKRRWYELQVGMYSTTPDDSRKPRDSRLLWGSWGSPSTTDCQTATRAARIPMKLVNCSHTHPYTPIHSSSMCQLSSICQALLVEVVKCRPVIVLHSQHSPCLLRHRARASPDQTILALESWHEEFFSLRDTTLTVMLSSAGTRLNVNRD